MKLYNRLSSFYIVINVPKCLRKRIGKSQIWRSLHTKDRRIANLRAGMIKMSVHKPVSYTHLTLPTICSV